VSWFGAPAPRHVRLHLQVHSPIEAHDGTMTIEGYLTGRQPVAGHYLLDRAKILEHRLHAEHQESIRTISLDGGAEVPERRVIFVEVLKVSGQK
jgi:hypothetical protein